MRWTVHLEGGPRRVNHAAVCINDKIYSFGGYCSTDEYKDGEPIPVHVLDTTTLRWLTVDYIKNDTVPHQRYGHTAVAYRHKVYMWGGRNDSEAYNTLSCFDTKTLSWSYPSVTGMAPYAKDGHSACLIKNKMYIFGGYEYLGEQYSQDVHCLDLDTLEWTFVDAKGVPPSHRDFHTAVAIDEKMYIFGGRSDLNGPYSSPDELYCPQIFYLDTVNKVWVVVSPTGAWPTGRRSHSAWFHDGYMYIFGGYNGNTRTHFNDLHRLSIKDNHWQQLNVGGAVPCKRRRQASLIYNDKLYLFGGTSPAPNAPISADKPEMLIDNSDLHVLDYSLSLKTICILKILEYNLDQTVLPRDILIDIRTMTMPNRISRPINQNG